MWMDLNAINCLKCFSFDIVVTVINQQIKSSATRVWHITLPVITQSVRRSRLQIKVNPHEANAKAEPIVRRNSLLLGLKDYWLHSENFRSDVAFSFARCVYTIRLYRNVYIISETAVKPDKRYKNRGGEFASNAKFSLLSYTYISAIGQKELICSESQKKN